MHKVEPQVALFHDSLCQQGGAERVAEELHRALSKTAPVAFHTTVASDKAMTPYMRQQGIRSTWMKYLPMPHKFFRAYFLLFPFAVESADLSSYDLIVTSCIGYSKGVKKREATPNHSGALHICYCHTPMRWVWRTTDYLAREGNARLKAFLLHLPLRWLMNWEIKAATRPDFYLANSHVVARRLYDAFGVVATVIPPPIDTARFAPPEGQQATPPEDFYLVLSRLVPYKRFDLAIRACVALNRKLVVIGDGTDRSRLEKIAAGNPNITFLGRASDEVVVDHARRTRGLIFPGEEDFGMTPLEINAAGRPVVAFRRGGATETIVDGLNGVFFDEATPESLEQAILRFEQMTWDPVAIRAHAASFDTSVFRRRIMQFVETAMTKHRAAASSAAPIMFPTRAVKALPQFGGRVGRAS